jgi:hypothetical protein
VSNDGWRRSRARLDGKSWAREQPRMAAKPRPPGWQILGT